VRLSGPEAVGVAERLVRLVGNEELADERFHARARRALVVDPAAQNTGVSPLRRKERASGRDDSIEVAQSARASVEMTGVEVAQSARHTSTALRIEMTGEKEGVIDEALVTVFHAPNSYTGEDVVEIAAHGAPVVMEALVRGAIQAGSREQGVGSRKLNGARLAAPGEFTQRAFLAGRIDLTQAEAVGDLIAAQTLEQARAAAQQLGGALSRRVTPAKEALLHLIALLEAGMDFASGELDDVDVVAPEQIAASIEAARAPLQVLADSFHRGQLLRHGAAIALVGRPNAGKSSLFNRLLERERAIVTPLPGTTRDTVEESLALGGVPVRLVDTAGIRDTAPTSQKRDVGHPEFGSNQIDEAERQGIVRSREALADADLVLLVRDASLAVEQDEFALMEELRGRPHLVVENKCDLLGPSRAKAPAIATSALTGEGIDTLREAILRELGAAGSLAEGGLLNNLRQQQAVTATLSALAAAADANQAALPHEILLLELHNALRSLDSLTGETTTDDILGRIFATFCIGK
jgi:tRNA modification GTPase